MTTKFVLPTTFTDTSLPKFRLDPMLPDAGALLLIDPMHPVEPWAEGVPTFDAPIPNLAESQARALVGGTATLDAFYQSNYTQETTTGVHGFAERSVKGGLHAVFTRRTPEADVFSNKGTLIGYPVALRDWMAGTGKPHKFFVSLWTRTTRLSRISGQASWVSQFGRATSITGNFGYAIQDHASGLARAGTGTIAIENGYDSLGHLALGDRRRGGGWEPPDDLSGGAQAYVFNVGTYGTANTFTTARGNQQSQILHRFYLEDLTVSGRTSAEVAALDLALWTQDVATPGGRYYGDNFVTDPATVP